MNVVISAGGRFHAHHLACQLERRGHLQHFFTTAYTRRDHRYVPASRVTRNVLLDYADTAFYKLRLSKIIPARSWYVFKDNWFDTWARRHITRLTDVDIFVGWAHYFLTSAPMLRAHGVPIILESGSTHILEMDRLLRQEAAYVGFKEFTPISERNKEKMLQEYDAADYIMVPSKFVRDSFIAWGIVPSKIRVVPYGVNAEQFARGHNRVRGKADAFTVLFVGLVGFRKGVHRLLEVWKRLNFPKAQLRIIGYIEESFRSWLKCQSMPDSVTFVGPLSPEKLLDEYHNASLFVLPSIEEGLAMVQSEAMAAGLPVICTTNTGGGEFIDDGIEGFVLAPRDDTSLREKIQWCYEHRQEAALMGEKALEKVQYFTWDHYGDKVVAVYESIVEGV